VNVGMPEGTVNGGMPEGNGIADGKPLAGTAPPSTTDAAGRAEPVAGVPAVGGRTPSPRKDPRSPFGGSPGRTPLVAAAAVADVIGPGDAPIGRGSVAEF
jgi:hypothetical protein